MAGKQNPAIVVHVDFPALADLVAYLRDRDTQQAKIDQLTSQASQSVDDLKKSAADLDAAEKGQ